MKIILRSLSFIVLSLLMMKRSHSQCRVSDIIVQNISITGSQVPGTCTVTFDASFAIEENNGNKYIFIHAWLEDDYPNYFQCVNGQSTLNGSIASPRSGDLGEEFLTIGINNNVDPPTVLTTYPPDQNVPMTHVNSIERVLLPNGSAIFILRGITTTVPVPCGTPISVELDVWSSQSAQAQRAHCVNCGIRQGVGFVSAQGFVNCANMTFIGSIRKNIAAPVEGFYTVHADVNGDGFFTASVDTMVIDTTNFSLPGGIGSLITINGALQSANLNQDVFLVITQTAGPAPGTITVVLLPSNVCGALPVTFRSFTAKRIDANRVALEWETATEINNFGFTILKNNGEIWEQVEFIPTQAVGGNSNAALTYSFMDKNSHRGISQYRIRQVDLDGKIRFSEIRAVRGDGQSTDMTIYPNPSSNGTFSVVFDDRNLTRDAVLLDMNGRTIRQWQGVTNNTIRIENIRPGIYTIRVTTRETGAQNTGKVMVTQ